MRYLLFSLLIVIMFSCNRTNNQNSDDLVYSIDSVIVDSKGKLLDLNRRIVISDLDDEKRFLFLYNEFDHSIDEINLDRLEFTNNFSFNVEGPNGTGGYFNNFNILKNGFMFIKSFNKTGIFEKNGNLLRRIDWLNSIDTKGAKYGVIPKNEILIGTDDLKVFGLRYNYESRDFSLDVLTIAENNVIKLNLDSKESYSDLVLEIKDQEIYFDPYVYLKSENDFIIISHEFSNEIILYNHEGELFKTINYNSRLTPNRVKAPKGINIGNREILQKEFQKYLEQVEFYPPVWDNLKKRYFRLSVVTVFREREVKDSFLPKVLETHVYLSVFDKNFDLINELKIPELNFEEGKYFAKDGKLWVFQNFSDELGFIIIDI